MNKRAKAGQQHHVCVCVRVCVRTCVWASGAQITHMLSELRNPFSK